MSSIEEIRRLEKVIKADRTGVAEDVSGAISHDVREVLKQYFKSISSVNADITVTDDGVKINIVGKGSGFKNNMANIRAV